MSARHLQLGDEVLSVELSLDGDLARVAVGDGEPQTLALPRAGATAFPLVWRGRTHRIAVARADRAMEVCVDGERFVVTPVAGAAAAAAGDGGDGGPVRAPMPGKVVELPVAVGDRVSRGATEAAIEAMKLRSALPSPCDGTVTAVPCEVGEQVTGGQVLVEIEPE